MRVLRLFLCQNTAQLSEERFYTSTSVPGKQLKLSVTVTFQECALSWIDVFVA